MKIYKTQKEVEKDIKNGVLAIDGDVTFRCYISIPASIIAKNITALNITAWNINAWDITADNIQAGNIDARDITAWNIDARDIIAEDITARDIDAWDINAENISYYALCCAYNSIRCQSIQGRRHPHHPPICLDGKLTIESKNPQEITIDGATYTLKENK